jgi:hypothetical protein
LAFNPEKVQVGIGLIEEVSAMFKPSIPGIRLHRRRRFRSVGSIQRWLFKNKRSPFVERTRICCDTRRVKEQHAWRSTQQVLRTLDIKPNVPK